ncbi:MAG: hypothetical protein NW206_01850 [Hyphomonadaceae bacterium]|nr:hypothetical protein [Hyphomonadaceae bacterium]
MKVSDYQKGAAETDRVADNASPAWAPIAFGLNGQVGALNDLLRRRVRDSHSFTAFKDEAKRELGSVFWYATTLATRLNLDLEEILVANLKQASERWGKGPEGPPEQNRGTGSKFFDASEPHDKQLPRKLTVEFRCEEKVQAADLLPRVKILVDGVQRGDTIDDNAHKPDGYRFHDTQHLAFAAHLGWSPVIRALLGCKRKDHLDGGEVDRVEDGARARDTEEAIVRIIHAWASRFNYFIGVQGVDTELLNIIKSITRGLEVECRHPLQWEQAIISAYRLRKEVMEGRGGFVTADLDAQTLTYHRP